MATEDTEDTEYELRGRCEAAGVGEGVQGRWRDRKKVYVSQAGERCEGSGREGVGVVRTGKRQKRAREKWETQKGVE